MSKKCLKYRIRVGNKIQFRHQWHSVRIQRKRNTFFEKLVECKNRCVQVFARLSWHGVETINSARRPTKLISLPVNQNCELYLARRAALIVVASVEFRVRHVPPEEKQTRVSRTRIETRSLWFDPTDNRGISPGIFLPWGPHRSHSPLRIICKKPGDHARATGPRSRYCGNSVDRASFIGRRSIPPQERVARTGPHRLFFPPPVARDAPRVLSRILKSTFERNEIRRLNLHWKLSLAKSRSLPNTSLQYRFFDFDFYVCRTRSIDNVQPTSRLGR